MIAAKETHSIHILAFGINSQEQSILSQLAQTRGGSFELAHDDLDLWSRTQDQAYDVCVLGQNEKLPDPCYLVWLLRGVIPRARIIVIYDLLNPHETERLHHIEATHVLVRPVQIDQLTKHFGEATENQTDDGAVSESILSRLHPGRILSWLK